MAPLFLLFFSWFLVVAKEKDHRTKNTHKKTSTPHSRFKQVSPLFFLLWPLCLHLQWAPCQMVHTPSPPVVAPLGDDERRLRAFRRYVLWHSKMEVAAALHQTSGIAFTTAHSSTPAVDPIAPRVVGSLPPVEEFALPVFFQVHQAVCCR